MEWCRISTSTELVRVDTDRIVYVRTNNNNSDLALTNDKAKCRAIAHVDQFYYIATRHKETLWALPMPSANTVSSMPSTSQAVPTTFSIAPKMVSSMT